MIFVILYDCLRTIESGNILQRYAVVDCLLFTVFLSETIWKYVVGNRVWMEKKGSKFVSSL